MTRMQGFYLRVPKPTERRNSFRIYKDGHPLAEPRLEALSQQYRDKKIDLEIATQEAKKILADVRAIAEQASLRESFPEPNLEVLALAIKDYEKRKIGAKSRRVAIAGLKRVLELLGERILHSANLDALQSVVDAQPEIARPKLAVYLNILLSHAARKDRVVIPDRPYSDVKYFTRTELEIVLTHIPEPYRNPVAVAFVAGTRLGETFGLQRMGRTCSVHITRQLFDDGTYGPPKWSLPGKPRIRWAPVMEWGRHYVEGWIEELDNLDEEKKVELRRLDWAHIVREASRAVFPKKPHKHLTYRDVRHCYAVYWLDKGATLRHVAQSMGNSEKVVREHYAPFVQTDEAELAMLGLEKKTG